jgi:repressor LexA
MGRQRTDRRDKVYQFIAGFIRDNGYAPSCEEISEAVGLSGKSHVHHYLRALEEEGRIERIPRTPRGLRLVGQAPSSAFEVRVEGYVAAGEPLEILDEPDEVVELTLDIADPRRDLFALRVEGDSMVDDLVGDGDLLIVERQQEVVRGQMAVVHLRDRNATTLKRIYPEGKQVRLQPAHPTLEPFYADARDVSVQGRVVAVVRQY